jgi:hypothetical protein
VKGMKKLVLTMISACALAIPASAVADRADGTVTLVCVDKSTSAIIFSVTVDSRAAQGQLQVIQAQENQLLPRINASCSIE